MNLMDDFDDEGGLDGDGRVTVCVDCNRPEDGPPGFGCVLTHIATDPHADVMRRFMFTPHEFGDRYPDGPSDWAKPLLTRPQIESYPIVDCDGAHGDACPGDCYDA